MVIYKYRLEKKRKGEIDMLNDEICILRDKLNKSIENGEDYSIIYQLSIELDELIAKYYRRKQKAEA
ncbi:unknown [Clostridium sp. CAG:575]|nr:unknown [Clostridium sp. CAG:575]